MAFIAGGYPIEEENDFKKKLKETEDVAARTSRTLAEIDKTEQVKPSEERVIEIGEGEVSGADEIKRKAGVPSAYEFERLKLAKKRLELQTSKPSEAEKDRQMKLARQRMISQARIAAVKAAKPSIIQQLTRQMETAADTRMREKQHALLERQQSFRERQVMPTAMQVIGKTPFEQQAQERAQPQGRDYAQFTQGVGMNIPSAAGGETIGGVGDRLGALLRGQRGVSESGQPTGGRDYGALFGTGGMGSRFGDILRGRQQVQAAPGQVPKRSIGDTFGDMLRGPMQAVTARPLQGVKGKIAPKRVSVPKRVASPFAKLLLPKKRKPFNRFG